MAADDRYRLHQIQPLPSYMARLSVSRASGVLVARCDASRREIIFVDGEVRAARSDLEDEKLGMWLVARQRISEDDRALTLLSQGGGDAPPIGHLLVTRGSLDTQTLEDELQELALTIIRRAAATPRTYCEFREGTNADQPDTLPNLTTPAIIFEAARAFDDDKAIRAAIGETSQVAWRAGDLDAVFEELNLTPTEGFFLSRLDGSRTIDNLLRVAPLPREQAAKILYTLIVTGLVHVGTGPHAIPGTGGRGPVVGPITDEAFSATEREERETIRKMAEQLPQIDHYRALGLRPGAPGPEIDSAWKAAQERYGTGRSEVPHLADLAAQIEAILERARDAYEVLSKPRSRTRYDSVLEALREERPASSSRSRGETDPGVRSQIVEANIKRAKELVEDGELYLAVQLLEQACALEPRPPALLDLARLLLRNPLWTNRALNYIRRAIEVDPRFVDAWVELAEFWRRRNNIERQRKALERALAVNPDHERANHMYRLLAGRRALDKLLKRARQSRS